ncbi:hypothetical protein BGZ57DRAFT_381144 [Hyaloscypha finlandica]|nr:hypothetical protein BGZ57DRAFT_381144 [Hyaloscypha finlandica]KAH8789467.1 hypothetical protein F5882DRAFT_104301 [Hyaloscypha sp. PMI_1271]
MPVEDDLPPNWGERANGPLCDAFFVSMKKARKRQWVGECCAGLPVLAILVTSPEFQGRGVGRLLCNEGLQIADREKLPAWLEASARGRRLYQKLGFEDVANIVIDLGK